MLVPAESSMYIVYLAALQTPSHEHLWPGENSHNATDDAGSRYEQGRE